MRDLRADWPKRCGSCLEEWDEPAWKNLPITSRAPLGAGIVVEVRRCRCGDILAVAVSAFE
jgi:hypothetical protein